MRRLLQFSVLVFLGLSFTNLLTGQQIILKPEKVLQPEAFTTTIPLRDMEFVPATGKTDWKNGIIPNHDYSPPQRNKNGQKSQKDGIDPVLQTKYNNSAPNPKAIVQNFEGISNINGVAPPDTDGDVGPNHYIQIVNLSFQIFDKSGTALTLPASLSTIWNNLPGPWSGNYGDPIALYDELTDRWLLSQFSLPNYPSGPFYELIAISASGDPLGSYHLYAYQFTDMPDYPKFGIWTDGYYMSINQFSSGSLNWAGAGAVVFEKSQMLDGNPAQMVFFNFSASQDPYSFLPCDIDGTQPPPNTPNYFAYVNYWSVTDRLRIYQLTVDWVNTGNSTFTGPYDVTVATINNTFSTDIRQPGTTQRLDPIEDRLMYRLQYRNFGSYQTLVTNHTVDVGSDRAGVRWYELRNSGGGWSMYQQGTYAPTDAHSRWMASVAMNRNGDIALGYSISSSSLSPSIRYTGRLSTDPPGVMNQPETSIITGSGYQSGTYRWGDYSAMSIDPVDDYTFWYTQEYVNPGGNFAWRTRIASFQFGLPPVPDTWTGIASNNWNDANNWNDLSVPYRSDDIIIPGSPLPPFYPVYTGAFTLGLQSNDLTLNSGAEMKVAGDLTISAGRSLTCSSTEKIYVDGNWANNNGTFTPGNGTVEFNGSNTATMNSGSGSLSFWNLDINKTNATVTANCFVNINNDLTVRSGAWFTNATGNTMNVTGNALFEADAVSMASYIDNGTLNVTGTTTVELYLTEMKWHYVSPPISDAKLGVFHLPGGHSDIYAKYWDELNEQWVKISDVNLDLNVEQGYAVWVADNGTGQDETIEFIGTLNNNVINPYPLTHTTTNTDIGWNHVGNPYPSALDWDATSGWTKTNTDNTIYYWNPSSGSGNYSYYVGSGTAPWTGGTSVNNGTRFIPAMQGFIVHCNNSSGGSIKIENSARVHDAQSYYKNVNENTNFLRLKTTGNGYWDETVIRFFESATEGFDSDYDAYKLFGLDEAPQLYSIIPGKVLSVNSLSGFDEYRIVDLGFECGVPAIFTIEASETESFEENITIYLEDLKEGIMHNLCENPSYAFVHEIGNDPNRFLLHFGEPSSIDENNQFSVRIYSNENIIYIQNPENIDGDIIIYDMLGQEIIREKIENKELIRIKLTQGTGYYLVKVQSDKQLVTEKVFIR